LEGISTPTSKLFFQPIGVLPLVFFLLRVPNKIYGPTIYLHLENLQISVFLPFFLFSLKLRQCFTFGALKPA